MDNKKWYKKFGTIFWWVFTIMPLIVALIQFIGYHLTFNSGISSAVELANYHDNSIGNFYSILCSVLIDFGNFTMSSLIDVFSGLFDILGVTNNVVFGTLFAFMVSVQLYHLLYDVLICFIHLIHDFMESVGNRI